MKKYEYESQLSITETDANLQNILAQLPTDNDFSYIYNKIRSKSPSQ